MQNKVLFAPKTSWECASIIVIYLGTKQILWRQMAVENLSIKCGSFGAVESLEVNFDKLFERESTLVDDVMIHARQKEDIKYLAL